MAGAFYDHRMPKFIFARTSNRGGAVFQLGTSIIRRFNGYFSNRSGSHGKETAGKCYEDYKSTIKFGNLGWVPATTPIIKTKLRFISNRIGKIFGRLFRN